MTHIYYYKYQICNLHAHTLCIFYKPSNLFDLLSKSLSKQGKSVLVSQTKTQTKNFMVADTGISSMKDELSHFPPGYPNNLTN